MKRLKDALLLSEQGYKDLKKAIGACTLTNLSMMLPFCVTVMIFRELLEGITEGSTDTSAIWKLWIFGIVSAVAVFLCAKNDYRKTYIASYKESNKTRERLAEHLCGMPMSFFNTRDLTEITSNMMSDCSAMESMLSSTIPPLIADIISSAVMCVMLAFFDIRLALCVFITIPLAFIIIIASKSKQKKLFRSQNDIKLEASARIQEYLEGVKIIKACGVSGKRHEALDRTLRALKDMSVKTELAIGVFISGASMILQSGIGITIFAGCALLLSGKVELLTLLMFLLMATRIYGPILAVLGQLSTLMHLDVVTDRMRSLMIADEMGGTEKTDGGNIEVIDARFGYNDEEVIHGVSFKVEKESVTALVGPSGSGKSTMSKLIARFWDVNGGCIRFGGKDIKNISPSSLMEHMSFVFQDVTLFNDTIFNNIKMGRESASDEEVYAAAKAAFCDEFVSKLPHGYETVIGENGGTLSGGERQRISIARALLKDAEIIILDEATASLDPENELFVQQAIARLVENKTVIMIAHRLRTVADADNIIVFDGGRIAEQGTHRQLMEKGGIYRRMYELQMNAS
ncbi:MAG: ABC transporter ATP-binding protein [Oscillospiraceae bacterium]|nr:ABC transporter ATP-binding protein [Oscillospiraceae bacterium]